MKAIDMSGEKHNSLLVIEKIRKNNAYFYRCVCDCGNTVVVKRAHLIRLEKPQKSCRACFLKRISIHGKSKTKEFFAWRGILSRCNDINSKPYKDYGGRGIKHCKEWIEFNNFLNDMGLAPSKKHTIERIDVNKDYEPSNCKWATWKEQANNKRNNIYIEFNGETTTLTLLAEKHNILPRVLMHRLRRGWEINKAINTLVIKRNRRSI